MVDKLQKLKAKVERSDANYPEYSPYEVLALIAIIEELREGFFEHSDMRYGDSEHDYDTPDEIITRGLEDLT